ncbi:MAG: hypothetical protein WC806_00685 [Candidatus Gracilibacteria bacterium]|jgi:uncharacterized integral membrane protein
MKVFYLTGSIIFTVLILILAFENIQSSCTGLYFFFYAVDSSPTIITLALTILGIITGMFYHALIQNALNTSEDEEDDNI